jgi:hypothetical protein
MILCGRRNDINWIRLYVDYAVIGRLGSVNRGLLPISHGGGVFCVVCDA